MENDGLVVPPDTLQALDVGQGGRRRHRVQEHVHAAQKVEMVVDFLHSGLVRQAVEELQRPEARLDCVRRGDGGRNARGHPLLGAFIWF